MNSRHPFFDHVRWTFVARTEDVEASVVENELEFWGLTGSQKDFLWKWIKGEINLV